MSDTNALHERRHFPNPDYYTYADNLGDQITELSGHLNAANYQLLKLIGEFDKNEGWYGGYHSCAHWLNHRCGTSMGTGREKVRVARALPFLPKISEAFREGRISYSKVRAMTRIATPENENELLNTALYGTAYHVELQVRLYRRCKRLEALRDENLRHAARELSWYTDEDGSWVMKGRFTPEQGAVIQKALEGAMDELFEEQKAVPEDVSAETQQNQMRTDATLSSVGTRRADAMERVAEGFLANKQSESSGGDRYLVNVHTDMDTLREDGEAAVSELEDQSHVSAETSRRMACDCSRVDWQEDENGNPLNIGRKTRTIPSAIRRALKRRDHGCRFPGCTCSRFVDAHHVKHWADGGETSVYNLVLLCRNHHRLVHEGDYGVHINKEQAVHFTMPDGTELKGSGSLFPFCGSGSDLRERKMNLTPLIQRSRGNVIAIETANRNNRVEITAETAVTRWGGEEMDRDMAVDALYRCENRSNSDPLDD